MNMYRVEVIDYQLYCMEIEVPAHLTSEDDVADFVLEELSHNRDAYWTDGKEEIVHLEKIDKSKATKGWP